MRFVLAGQPNSGKSTIFNAVEAVVGISEDKRRSEVRR